MMTRKYFAHIVGSRWRVNSNHVLAFLKGLDEAMTPFGRSPRPILSDANMPQSIPAIPPHALADQQAALEAQPPTTAAPAFPVPNPTVSFWQKNIDVSPKPAHGSEGPLTTDADICIIGSGISGVSTAYHLAKIFAQDGSQGPIKAVILEARDFCEHFVYNRLHLSLLTRNMRAPAQRVCDSHY
jgi:hypothetical protein